MNFPRKQKYGAIMAELPYIMATFLSAAINNFHIFMAIYGYCHYGVPIPEPHTSHYPSRPVTKIPTNYSYQPLSQSSGRNFKSCNDVEFFFKNKRYVRNFFERISVAHIS